MWARVKGKTENDLMHLFNNAYMFRPAIMEPTKGLKNTLKWYVYLGWLLPMFRVVFPNYVCTLRDVGRAMINAVANGYSRRILEVPDIIQLARNSN